jgi:hypothetical protein
MAQSIISKTFYSSIIKCMHDFMIQGLGCFTKSGKCNAKTSFYFCWKGITQQWHLFLFVVSGFYKVEMFISDAHFYLSLRVTFVFRCVIAHCCFVCCFYGYFFGKVWCRWFVVSFEAFQDLFFWHCFFTHLGVIGGSCLQIVIVGTSWVLFCWVWCSIMQVLWVHLCNFNVVDVFLLMAISMASVFFLHYNYSYIANDHALWLLLHCDSFKTWILLFFMCNISR